MLSNGISQVSNYPRSLQPTGVENSQKKKSRISISFVRYWLKLSLTHIGFVSLANSQSQYFSVTVFFFFFVSPYQRVEKCWTPSIIQKTKWKDNQLSAYTSAFASSPSFGDSSSSTCHQELIRFINESGECFEACLARPDLQQKHCRV